MPKAQWLNQYLKSVQAQGRFDIFLKNVKILQADNGNCIASVKLTKDDLNPMGGLHGGFSVTFIDSISGYGLLTHKDWSKPSVSVNINISYMKGAKVNDEIKLVSKVLKAGKSMAFLDVELYNAKTGQLLVKAEHTKFKM